MSSASSSSVHTILAVICRFVVLDMPNLAGLPMLSPPYTAQQASTSGKVTLSHTVSMQSGSLHNCSSLHCPWRMLNIAVDHAILPVML